MQGQAPSSRRPRTMVSLGIKEAGNKLLPRDPERNRIERRFRKLMESVFEVGGFPKSVNEHPDAEEAFVKGLISEIYRQGKSLRMAQDILSSILEKMPGAMSYNSVASDVGISHNTVREYIEFFTELLIAGVAYLKCLRERRRRSSSETRLSVGA